MVMAFGAFDKSVSWGDAGKVWLVSYLGNFVGCLIFGLFFVWAGGVWHWRLFRRLYQ